jgi:hypothetical protein
MQILTGSEYEKTIGLDQKGMDSKSESAGRVLLQGVGEFSLDSKPCQPKAGEAPAGTTIRRK